MKIIEKDENEKDLVITPKNENGDASISLFIDKYLAVVNPRNIDEKMDQIKNLMHSIQQ
jgi:hypothetical protein